MNATAEILLSLPLMAIVGGCLQKNTTDPHKAYKYWMNHEPSKEVELLHAKYWESPHWSKEYEIFMEMKASATWRASASFTSFRAGAVSCMQI